MGQERQMEDHEPTDLHWFLLEHFLSQIFGDPRYAAERVRIRRTEAEEKKNGKIEVKQ